MVSLFKTVTRMSPHAVLKRLLFRLHGRVLHFKPKGVSHGNVLISYTTVPFTLLTKNQFGGHTNYWESREMVLAFLERGYAVDLIDKTNTTFVPKKPYVFFIDIQSNLKRLAPLLNPDCIKIFHATGSYWTFQNPAEQKRLDELAARRGVQLLPRRATEPYYIDDADIILSLCGPFPESTYAPFNKPIYHIPLSTTHTYPRAEKDFNAVKKHFIWFGGAGAVHKGLDLVLEAFARMPDYELVVCGKFNEQDFLDAYKKELFETPNIRAVGRIDPGSEQFKEICNTSLGVVFPSCSEGCASSVVICMHAGLIPLVSRESGIETGTFGITFKENTIEEIMQDVKDIAAQAPLALQDRSRGAWEYARATHTREHFGAAFRAFIDSIEQRRA